MRRLLIACAFLAVAVTAQAASPFYLDRCGVLWKGTSTHDGLLLTGEVDGEVQISSLVPFVVGFAGNEDSQIQVAADEVTGKVAVVWQRTYAEGFSEVFVAIWANHTWERILRLGGSLAQNPRFPVTDVSSVETTVPDPEQPDDPMARVTIRDSFLHVAWWQGSSGDQHGVYTLLRLTAPGDDDTAVLTRDLDSLIPVGIRCRAEIPPSVLEHPLFASGTAHDRAHVLFASRQMCLFHLAEIRFELEPEQISPETGLPVEAQRRRHIPIFGIRRTYQTPESFNMEDARMVLGPDLRPVGYRVVEDRIEYVVASDRGWSPVRTLPVSNGLTIDRAIPLIENLAR